MLPNFLLIGAARSGTTWIEKNLRAHPDVFLPARKELHFFDRDYAKGLEFYAAYFAEWSGQKAVGEASPSYLSAGRPGHDIPAMIAQHLPGVRLIASLRNPVDRVYSRFWNAKAKFDHNAQLSFEQKLLDKPEFLDEGTYADHLERFFRNIPRERMLVLLYDDLVADGRGFMRRIYEFLAIDPDVATGLETLRINSAEGKGSLARSKPLWLASRALNRFGARELAEKLRVRNSVPLPEMSEATRVRLIEHYRPHNERLARLIQRDLSAWNQA